jgi:hypothetical protein
MRIVTIRDRKGQGDLALYVRLRNVSVEYWDFVTGAWVPTEVANSRVYLTEYPDSSTVESRYQNSILLPPADLTIEYVRSFDGLVIGEETIDGGAVAGSGTGQNVVTVTALEGTTPVPNVLVQAWRGGVVVAAALTNVNGEAGLGLDTGAVEFVLTRASWGVFPTTTYTVIAGPQTLTVLGTASPPSPSVVPAFAVPIQVADAATRLLAGFSTIELSCSDDLGGTWRNLTAPTALAPSIASASTDATYRVGGLSVGFKVDGVTYTTTFDPLLPDLTPSQVAQAFNVTYPGIASAVGSTVVLTGPTVGSGETLEITSATASALGFRAGQVAYGAAQHIAIAPDTLLYSFVDPHGTSARRYRWRFSDNGGDPISPYMPYVYGSKQLTGVLISFGTARFAGSDGMSSPGQIIVANMTLYAQGMLLPGTSKAYAADEQGFVAIPLVQGATVRIAVDGTYLVRDIVVPSTPSFDIMQALTDAPDAYSVQTVPPLLTRRSL